MQTLTDQALTPTMSIMPEERKSETFAFRVPARLYNLVQEIAASERRKMAEVQLAIFERGIAAYHRDGLIFEPSAPREAVAKTRERKTG